MTLCAAAHRKNESEMPQFEMSSIIDKMRAKKGNSQ